MHDQGLTQRGLEQAQLRGAEVTHPKGAHFSLGVELAKNIRNLVDFHQIVGPMKLKQIEMFDSEGAEGTLALGANVLLRKIIPRRSSRRLVAWADAALAGDQHPRPEGGVLAEDPPKNFLRCPIAVNVRVVEEGETGIDRCKNRFPSDLHIFFGIRAGGNTPASISELT
jgi:hypothetical protein